MDDQAELRVDGGDASGKVHVWILLYRRKWLFLVGVVVGLGLGYLYYLKKRPVYESTARILIRNNEVRFPALGFDTAGTLAPQDKLNTQIILMRSPLVAGLAVQKHDLGKLPSLAGAPD